MERTRQYGEQPPSEFATAGATEGERDDPPIMRHPKEQESESGSRPDPSGDRRLRNYLRGFGILTILCLTLLAFQRRAEIVAFFHKPTVATDESTQVAQFVPGQARSFLLKNDAVETLGITWARVHPMSKPLQIQLSGKLYLDPNRFVSVHTRFAGEVVRLGDPVRDPGSAEQSGPLRFGDRVQKGQLLAVLWSKEVGDEKSDLVDALSRLRFGEKTLKRLKELEPTGAITERAVHEAQRNFEADLIGAIRAERTLRSWRLPEEEIASIKAEAERLHANPDSKNPDLERRWAEVNIISPIDGVVVEHDAPVGDVVDAGDILFKVADLSQLGVVVNLYEDDLPQVLSIPKQERKMIVRITNDPGFDSVTVPIDRIGEIIDPNQHTVAVTGWINNDQRMLRSGQFVSGTIDLPIPEGLVALPSSSVIDRGFLGTIFVSPGENSTEFSERKVAIVRRTADEIYIRAQPDATEAAQGAQPLHEGEWAVSSGVLTLTSILSDLDEANPEAKQVNAP